MNAQQENSPRKLRVLIADDASETRRTTQLMLAENPLVEIVAIADNGKSAIELAQKYKPDMAILDINMPEVDGFSASKVMQQENPDLACIIISAEKGTHSFRTAMSVGAREYLTKPFTFDELNNTVAKVGKLIREKTEEDSYTGPLPEQRKAYLTQMAEEYTQARRTDDQALEVFERLAEDPECDRRWLRTLAMIYVIRKKWKRLQALAGRLAEMEKNRRV